MGKPFNSELKSIDATLDWGLGVDLEHIRDLALGLGAHPLIAIGAGGSFTAAKYLELLHQRTSEQLSKAVTPLEFLSMATQIRNSSIVILSAGGNNKDVIRAAEHAIIHEPRSLLAICTRPGSKLALLSRSFPLLQVAEFEIPSESDGFLATHSLLATSIILGRAFDGDSFDSWCWRQCDYIDEFADVPELDTWIALHSGWASPAAVDLESKCSEAGLAHILLTDYRNFGHGRHQWLSKRGETSAVVAFYSAKEAPLAKKTISELPPTISVVEVGTKTDSSAAMVELLVREYHLVSMLGKARKIDPGRPGVPKWGRNIYHLTPPQLEFPLRKSRKQLLDTACQRKGRTTGRSNINQAAESYLRKLEGSTIEGVVFDFDGTLCETHNRFQGLDPILAPLLERLMDLGIAVGVATGRGASVRSSIVKNIAPRFHERILLGYYNGSQIGMAIDETKPDKNIQPYDSLVEFLKALDVSRPGVRSKFQVRPHQISFRGGADPHPSGILDEIEELVFERFRMSLKVLRSGHSLDVTPLSVSKLEVIESLSAALGHEDPVSIGAFLSIGDRGDRFGNDFELLTTPLSLSVDTVSVSRDSCWNFAPPGCRNVTATRFYLECLIGGQGKFDINRGIDLWKRCYE